MDNTTLLSTEQKLKFIKESYHSVSCSNVDDLETCILKLMTKRFNDSKRSFCALYERKYTFDAMLVAGYMLELLAQITKIRENRIKAKEIWGKALYEKIKMMLIVPEQENKLKWEQSFQEQIMMLEECATKTFKKQSVLSILKDNSLSRQEKLKQLDKQRNIFRHKTDIRKDVRCFVQHAKKVFSSNKRSFDEYTLGIVYRLYCCHKHSNLLPLIESEIDLASFIVILSIVEYCDCGKNLVQLLQCYEVLS